MKPKSVMNILFVILMLSFSVFVVSSSFINIIYDLDFYKSELSKNSPDVEVPLDKILLLTSYFRNNDLYLNQESMVFIDKQFTPEELNHLLDVKLLINKLEAIYFYSLIISIVTSFLALFIIYFYGKKQQIGYFIRRFFGKTLGSIILLIVFVLLILFIFGKFFYNDFFIKFHEIFFMDGTWTFSTTSLLITLFPYQFFNNAFFNFLIILFKNLGLMFLLWILIIIEFALHVNKNDGDNKTMNPNDNENKNLKEENHNLKDEHFDSKENHNSIKETPSKVQHRVHHPTSNTDVKNTFPHYKTSRQF